MASNGLDLKPRLQRVMQDGNLSVADLARWLGRSDPTVRGWVNGIRMAGTSMEQAWISAALNQLERRIKRKQGLPVPRMSQRQRKAYLEELRNDDPSP